MSAWITARLAPHSLGAGLIPPIVAGRQFQDPSGFPFPARPPRAGLIPRATAGAPARDSCIRLRRVSLPRHESIPHRGPSSSSPQPLVEGAGALMIHVQAIIQQGGCQGGIKNQGEGAQGLNIGELWDSRGAIGAKPTISPSEPEACKKYNPLEGRKSPTICQ